MRLPTVQQKKSNATFRLLSGMKFKSKCQAARLKLKLISRVLRKRRKPLMTCYCCSKSSSNNRSGHGKTKCDLAGEEATWRRVWGAQIFCTHNPAPHRHRRDSLPQKCARLSLFLFFTQNSPDFCVSSPAFFFCIKILREIMIAIT